jgi:hypothetical protein
MKTRLANWRRVKEAAMAEQRPWHQYFGLCWVDFWGTEATVDTEKDLSHKRQLLDLVFTLPPGTAPPHRLPDGFEDLGRYNLVTFKSYREALDGEALDELVGHSVNLRKQASPTMQNLLPPGDFRRFAVCVRTPHNLLQQVQLRRLGPGVYEARHFSGSLRVVVVNELPREEHNAMLLMFSAEEEVVDYAYHHYRPYSPEISTLLLQMINRYRLEGIPMPPTLQELAQRTIDELLKDLPPEKRLEGLPAEELLKRLSPEKRLEGLSPEQRLAGLSPEQLKELEELARRRLENGGQTP